MYKMFSFFLRQMCYYCYDSDEKCLPVKTWEKCSFKKVTTSEEYICESRKKYSCKIIKGGGCKSGCGMYPVTLAFIIIGSLLGGIAMLYIIFVCLRNGICGERCENCISNSWLERILCCCCEGCDDKKTTKVLVITNSKKIF